MVHHNIIISMKRLQFFLVVIIWVVSAQSGSTEQIKTQTWIIPLDNVDINILNITIVPTPAINLLGQCRCSYLICTRNNTCFIKSGYGRSSLFVVPSTNQGVECNCISDPQDAPMQGFQTDFEEWEIRCGQQAISCDPYLSKPQNCVYIHDYKCFFSAFNAQTAATAVFAEFSAKVYVLDVLQTFVDITLTQYQ